MHTHTTVYTCIYTWEDRRGRGRKEGASWPRGQTKYLQRFQHLLTMNKIFTKVGDYLQIPGIGTSVILYLLLSDYSD